MIRFNSASTLSPRWRDAEQTNNAVGQNQKRGGAAIEDRSQKLLTCLQTQTTETKHPHSRSILRARSDGNEPSPTMSNRQTLVDERPSCRQGRANHSTPQQRVTLRITTQPDQAERAHPLPSLASAYVHTARPSKTKLRFTMRTPTS
ncbi:hypothetical protein F2Q68_00038927 [Brassica cretica]|uniref:DUF4005 domain-containing protein n=2 Tax=Brassica cretica TaxID=69181 RepID=A0ABQ7A7H7_BRACR|nr:hypothetical protein F2Q68_00038927 [Brassica cretica]KAF3493620.1 hypothetical protein DY000_02052492 [Brassica cretica]